MWDGVVVVVIIIKAVVRVIEEEAVMVEAAWMSVWKDGTCMMRRWTKLKL